MENSRALQAARRTLLGAGIVLAGTLLLNSQQAIPETPGQHGTLADPTDGPLPPSQRPGATVPVPTDEFDSGPRLDSEAIKKAEQQTLKKDVARLADLSQQLQKELESGDPQNVLSLDVLRKSQEIEKLVKQIKSLEKD